MSKERYDLAREGSAICTMDDECFESPFHPIGNHLESFKEDCVP